MVIKLPKVYPITDRRLSGLSHAEQVRRLIDGGAKLIQIREKHLPARQFYEEAVAAIKLAREFGVRIIVNDRVDIALTTEADGAHVGQQDLPPAEARKILGPGAIIGCSTHNLKQAVEASLYPVDYIAVGPIFDTSTKSDPDPIVGLDGLRRVRKALPQPCQIVAIGGINVENARSVIEAGADSVAVVSSLLSTSNEIPDRTRELIKRIG